MTDKKLTKVAMPEEDTGRVSMPEEDTGRISMPEEDTGKKTQPEEKVLDVTDSPKEVMHRNKNFCPQCGKKYGVSDSYCLNCRHPREVAKKW